jgi:hypothetical protein
MPSLNWCSHILMEHACSTNHKRRPTLLITFFFLPLLILYVLCMVWTTEAEIAIDYRITGMNSLQPGCSFHWITNTNSFQATNVSDFMEWLADDFVIKSDWSVDNQSVFCCIYNLKSLLPWICRRCTSHYNITPTCSIYFLQLQDITSFLELEARTQMLRFIKYLTIKKGCSRCWFFRFNF